MAEIVGIVASLLGPAIELRRCIIVPIKHRFNYLCCFNSNIQKLRKEADKLEDARAGLQMRVTTAENNAEVVMPEVMTWLKDVNEIQQKKSGIESKITNTKSGCLTVKFHLSLSRKAKNISEAMKELREYCRDFNLISQPAPSAATESIPLGSVYEFESRKHTEEEILITLRDNKVNMMGICGMGGVGKTTMARRVYSRVREEHLFDETVMVAVSQTLDMSRIQDDIAKSLDLKLEEGSLSFRAHKLRTRLVSGKRILIVLDDVWKNFELEDLGIPCESGLNGCKILLTSRDRGVLNEMGAQKVCEIQTLSEIEAWSLFKEKVGICVDGHNLLTVAQETAKECKGLPIALANVAAALKDKKFKFIWEDVLQQLKSSDPEDIPEVLEDVYKPLKLSYDFLDNQHAKSIFLLCCLFPEDHDIPLEYLTVYALGLRMFGRIRSLEQVRNRTYSLVEMLKSRFLLQDGWNEYHVKMHDIVRDVAIFIASEERRIRCSDCTWISPFLGERIELSIGSISSNLHILLIDNSTDDELQINDVCFEGMIELNVLSMRYYSLRSLPHTIELLKNLRTLILHSCELVETISVVCKLVNLEILICHQCDSIEKLPEEIGGLNRLKLLEFFYCRNLKTIAPGVISNLIGLEELKMVKSFDRWKAGDEGIRRKNEALSEIQSLSSLTCLEIEIKNPTLVAEQMHLSPKIVKFDISIGDYKGRRLLSKGFQKKMIIHLSREITLGNWIHECVRSVEYMALEGEGSKNLDLGQAQNLRSLTFRDCSTVKELVNITTSIDGRCDTSTVFPLLEYLKLDYLINLEKVCDIDAPIPYNSFKNLKELRLERLPALKHLWKSSLCPNNVVSLFNNLSSIYIYKCHSLSNLFSFAMAKDCFLHLRDLQVLDCKLMEQVFLWNEEEDKKDIGQSRRITFLELEMLELQSLPKLTTFCKGIESIEFPLLNLMRIVCCPQLTSLVSTTSSSGSGSDQSSLGGICHDHDEDDDSLHLFCKPERVAFGSLKELDIVGYNKTLLLWCRQIPTEFFTRLHKLEIWSCGAIRGLFSSSIAENVVNLRHLGIRYCGEMVKVIEDDKEKDACGDQSSKCLFPRLQVLRLWYLSKLEFFCQWRCALELPSLEKVSIHDCSQMDRFSLESVTTPNLKTVRIDSKHVINTKDLNDMLQRHLFGVKEEEKKKKREEEQGEEKEEREKKEEVREDQKNKDEIEEEEN